MGATAIAGLVFALLAVACGGDDGNGDSGAGAGGGGGVAATEAPSDATTGAGAEPTEAPAGGDSGSDVPANMARVTVGDQTYEFEMLVCVSLGGAVGGPGQAVDGSDITLEIDIPPEDWETSTEDWGPPYIRINDGVNEVDWRAGGDTPDMFQPVDASQSAVDSYTNDGGISQGTATFAETNAALVPGQDFEVVSGSFIVNCGS